MSYGAVFIRPDGAGFLGHVAFAFQTHRGYVRYGSVEGFLGKGWPIARPILVEQWNLEAREEVCMNVLHSQGYTEYKPIVGSGDVGRAKVMIDEWVSKSYILYGQNCANAVYYILDAYGCWLPSPNPSVYPITWFEDGLTVESTPVRRGYKLFSRTEDDQPEINIWDGSKPELTMEGAEDAMK